jgi:hypothetical protein
MCMLTYVPAGIQPDTDALGNGVERNQDGHGYAVVAGNRIIVGHSLDPEIMIKEFAAVRERHPDGPALFHSRFGTHGGVTKANCHPFRVGGDRRTVMAHNGILPSEVHPAKGDRRSDTRIAAEDLLPLQPFGSLAHRKARRRFEQWLGPSNKVLILTVDPAYGDRAILLNEQAGIWDNGIWYSNMDYQQRSVGVWQPAPGWWDDDWPATRADWPPEYLAPCGVCEVEGAINPMTGYCDVCSACVDCQAWEEDCLCYTPTRATAQSGDLDEVNWAGDLVTLVGDDESGRPSPDWLAREAS